MEATTYHVMMENAETARRLGDFETAAVLFRAASEEAPDLGDWADARKMAERMDACVGWDSEEEREYYAREMVEASW